eukprot:RCo002511
MDGGQLLLMPLVKECDYIASLFSRLCLVYVVVCLVYVLVRANCRSPATENCPGVTFLPSLPPPLPSLPSCRVDVPYFLRSGGLSNALPTLRSSPTTITMIPAADLRDCNDSPPPQVFPHPP